MAEIEKPLTNNGEGLFTFKGTEMNFKVGQKWRTRNNKIAVIKSVSTERMNFPIRACIPFLGEVSFTREGKEWQHACGDNDLLYLDTDAEVLEKQEIAITKPVPHVHAYYIKQWADGVQVQGRCIKKKGEWVDVKDAPNWWPTFEYRVKPTSVFRVAFREAAGMVEMTSIEEAVHSSKMLATSIGVLEFTASMSTSSSFRRRSSTSSSFSSGGFCFTTPLRGPST